MNHHVFLLKNTDADVSSSDDPYALALSSKDRLAEIIGQGGGKVYGGVIVTSGRAVDAWGNALKAVEIGTNGWGNIPFYVVGPRTESQLLDLRIKTPAELSDLLPSPGFILGAQEAGTGEALGRFISSDYPTRNGSNLPLLYLVGDKNAGGVEGALKETGIGLEMVQVYATSPNTSFEDDFEAAVKQIERGRVACVVFFAPSSAELALPTIRKHFELKPAFNQSNSNPSIKVVAIGPTTARALSEKHHVHVDAVSKKPEPNALVEAVVSLKSSI
ncbi:uroporphyrinogen-III synthase [Ceratobasidium sp. AG-Ba]|nr:uroporphyrinogen-III synthase [Ceratobasidium sp. AG-Ba]